MPNKVLLVLNLKAVKKRNKVEYIVTTNEKEDNEYLFDEDTLVKYNIMKDREFEKEEFDNILKDIKISRLTNKCINYLSYGARSKKELYKYLDKQNEDKKDVDIASGAYKKVNNFTQHDFNEVIKRLDDLGFIDDFAIANNIVNIYKGVKGKGYIIRKLNDKGISEEIINSILDSYSKEEEIESAKIVAYKLKDKNTKYPIKKQETLISSKLTRDGFSYDIIKNVISKLDLVDDSKETLEKDTMKLIKKYENKDKTIYEKRNLIMQSLINKGYSFKDAEQIVKSKLK